MAATDIRGNKDLVRGLDFTQTAPFIYKNIVYDTSYDADLLTVAVHQLFDVEIGEAFIGGIIVVETAFTSGGAATFQIIEGAAGDSFTGLIALASLAAGAVIPFGGIGNTGTGSNLLAYRVSTASTIRASVATAAFTAGKALIIGQFLRNLDDII